ncbi:hypothetical protein JRO89_XS01G0401900 [Xanthoceras sorbifolium]|uniref:C2 domain-containing protein n=1 Tax=Xanthoceras sorbifolium TaxID=99658 RepID=A0ABQ8IPI0_9ROSI|nr:hypothetical protein JRO89_XS01G0401900 [Xanthoceras sorbifolium]
MLSRKIKIPIKVFQMRKNLILIYSLGGHTEKKRQTRVSFEDEVEMPDFPDDSGFIFSPRKASICNSDEEVISDHEDNNVLFKVTPGGKMSHKDEVHNFVCGKQDGESTWSAVSKETEALICLNENVFCSSSHSAYTKTNKSCKGSIMLMCPPFMLHKGSQDKNWPVGSPSIAQMIKLYCGSIKSKSKPKFSFRFQLHKGGLSPTLISKNDNSLPSEVDKVPGKLKTIDQEECSIINILEDLHGNKAEQSESVPTEVEDLHWSSKRTMADLLDGLQDNSSLLRRNSKMYTSATKKKVQAVEKRISLLGDRTIDSEDLPEFVDSRSSSDDEVNYQNLKLVVPEMKKQTIADRFQEALGATSSDAVMLMAVPRPSGIGLFGRLQQIMQSEKSIDEDFLKLQLMVKPNNGPSCINVKILSIYLDAKLTVCRCSSGRDTEDPQWPESFQTMVNRWERTVIFNARVCCDVDLEVGNLIRIHKPWQIICDIADMKFSSELFRAGKRFRSVEMMRALFYLHIFPKYKDDHFGLYKGG